MPAENAAKLFYDAILSPNLGPETKNLLLEALEMVREDLKEDGKAVETLKEVEKTLVESGLGLDDPKD